VLGTYDVRNVMRTIQSRNQRSSPSFDQHLLDHQGS
jgi:hypothetical protein